MNLDEAIKRATDQQKTQEDEEDAKGREAILEVLRKGVDPAAFAAIQSELRPTEDHFGLKWQGWYYVIEMRDGPEGLSRIVYIYRPAWLFTQINLNSCDLENGNDLLLYLGRQVPNPEWKEQTKKTT